MRQRSSYAGKRVRQVNAWHSCQNPLGSMKVCKSKGKCTKQLYKGECSSDACKSKSTCTVARRDANIGPVEMECKYQHTNGSRTRILTLHRHRLHFRYLRTVVIFAPSLAAAVSAVTTAAAAAAPHHPPLRHTQPGVEELLQLGRHLGILQVRCHSKTVARG